MPYVHRDSEGVISKVTNWPNGSDELLPDDHPEVLAFRNPPPPPNPAVEIVAGIEAARAASAAAADLDGLKAAFADLCDALSGQQPGQASQIAGKPK